MVDFGGMADKAQGLVGEHSDQVKGGIEKVAEFVDDKIGERIGHDKIVKAENALSGLVDKLAGAHAPAATGGVPVITTVTETPSA